jgi:hypothetical protein
MESTHFLGLRIESGSELLTLFLSTILIMYVL